MIKTATAAWILKLNEILDNGEKVSPRGKDCLELLNSSTVIDMNYPYVECPPRKLGHKFQHAEAAWILSGDNRVETIAPYASAIKEFSDDGIYFAGAYGPRFVDQCSYVVDSLTRDPQTRQAVLTIWRPSPRTSSDIPCTVSVQFFIRDNKLYCIDTMRSSDIWLGWPYDVFNFSMMSEYIRILLSKKYPQLQLGNLYLNAGSQHLYSHNRGGADQALEWLYSTQQVPPTRWKYNFSIGGDLIEYLWKEANGR